MDEGNVVVFGPRESNIDNTGTGRWIPMHRRKGVFVAQLDVQAIPSAVDGAKHDEHNLMKRTSVFRRPA